MNRLKWPVEEFTTPDPVTATEDVSIDELRDTMASYGIRHLPIVKENQVVGIVSERDLKLVAGLDLKEKQLVRAGDIMAREPVAVDAQTPLDDVAFEMSQRKIGSVIVNEGSKFVGIFTSTDALNALIEIARSDEKTRRTNNPSSREKTDSSTSPSR